MKTIVITGGTDGVGRALAQNYLERGDRVVVIGTNHAKGKAFLTAAHHLDGDERASFIQAGLELIGENTRLIDQLSAQLDKVDILVLGARYLRSTRTETADGLESNFALTYLSRFPLSHGLIGLLRRADAPVVLNFGSAGSFGSPQWDDLQQRRRCHGISAMVHAGMLNGLLSVDLVGRYPDTKVRYVNNFPGAVATSSAGKYDTADAAQIAQLRATGKPVETALGETLPFLESGAHDRLTSVSQGNRGTSRPGSVFARGRPTPLPLHTAGAGQPARKDETADPVRTPAKQGLCLSELSGLDSAQTPLAASRSWPPPLPDLGTDHRARAVLTQRTGSR